MEHKVLLRAVNISKMFPGVKALDNVTFELRAGEVHAVVGENGAGKSTLMHILSGVFSPESGSIYLNGRKVKIEGHHHAERLDIATVYQELSLVEKLTVAENIFASRQPTNRLGLIKWQTLYRKTEELTEMLGSKIKPKTVVQDLKPADRQMVEIAKALSLRPKILILDEPTSSIGIAETENLFRVIKRLRDEGIGIVYVSHNLDEVFELADRITVLRDGKYVGTVERKEATVQQIIQMMVGRVIERIYGRKRTSLPKEKIIFSVRGFSKTGVFDNICFQLRQGEILGITGLVGSGRTDVARAIFGLDIPDRGELFLEDEKLPLSNPHYLIQRGIGFVPEDRKEQGLFLKMSVKDNIIAPGMGKCSMYGLINDRKTEKIAKKYVKRLNIVTPSLHQPVFTLSGGNQQKVLLAMWLAIEPKVLIVDEPTRGVDIAAKGDIHLLLDQLAANGVGIVLISSELPEILSLSDRVIVMRVGEIVGEFPITEADENKIMEKASGVSCQSHLSKIGENLFCHLRLGK